MALSKPKMVLIDLDGTLIDSVPDLAWCVDETMKALALPVRGEAKVRNWVGNGVPRLIERALVEQLDGTPSDALYAKAAPILKDLGIFDHFEMVISGDTLPLKKPDPASLLHGAGFFGVVPEQAMMIGDSVSDVKASRAAGFSIVCMSYGYNHGVDIRTAGPDAVIDSFAELAGLF